MITTNLTGNLETTCGSMLYVELCREKDMNGV
jgi:hypothetical protein